MATWKGRPRPAWCHGGLWDYRCCSGTLAKPCDVSGVLCQSSVKQRVARNPESVLATWTCDSKFLADLLAGRHLQLFPSGESGVLPWAMFLLGELLQGRHSSPSLAQV